eukprot:38122_1
MNEWKVIYDSDVGHALEGRNPASTGRMLGRMFKPRAPPLMDFQPFARTIFTDVRPGMMAGGPPRRQLSTTSELKQLTAQQHAAAASDFTQSGKDAAMLFALSLAGIGPVTGAATIAAIKRVQIPVYEAWQEGRGMKAFAIVVFVGGSLIAVDVAVDKLKKEAHRIYSKEKAAAFEYLVDRRQGILNELVEGGITDPVEQEKNYESGRKRRRLRFGSGSSAAAGGGSNDGYWL